MMARQSLKKGPVFTPARYGRGSSKRNRCLHCRVTFRSARDDAKYCSPRCRQAAYRARQAKPEQLDTPAVCCHCSAGFWSTNDQRKYCSASCRTLASRAKRAATIDTLAFWLGVNAERAADVLDSQGLCKVAGMLEACGWAYSTPARSWQAVDLVAV